MMGVQYDLFWRLNPRRLKPFLKSYELRIENKRDMVNFHAWINNLYMGQMIASMFNKGEKYFEEPIDLNVKEEKIDEPKVNPEAVKFSAMAMMFNKQFEERGDG